MYIWDGSKFIVKVLDGNGNRLGGVNVTFNINGVFYTRGTNENGIARLNINLDAVGDFIITSMYNGLSISNNIHIKPIQISAYDTILKSIVKNAVFDVINDTGVNVVSYDVDSDGNYIVNLGDLTGNIIDSLKVTKDGIILK